MMRSSFDKALEKMNELEKEQDLMFEKEDEKAEQGKTKAAEHYRHEAYLIGAEIKGMVNCLKILGLNAWKQCDSETNYIGVWHIPLDDIDKVC